MLGVVCILGAAGGIGYFYTQMLRHRLQQLRQLLQLMGLLKGEMEYQCSTLPEAMIHSGRQISGVCGDWFVATGQRMNRGEGIGFRMLWNEQVNMLQTQTVLAEDTVDELFGLGMQMSEPDKRTQLGALELTIQRMKEQEERLRKELPDKIKVFASLTVLAGVFLILLLL